MTYHWRIIERLRRKFPELSWAYDASRGRWVASNGRVVELRVACWHSPDGYEFFTNDLRWEDSGELVGV